MGIPAMRAEIHSLNQRIAELAAEVERLKQEVESWKTSAAGWQKIANVEAEALSRTGAVKVLNGVEFTLVLRDDAVSLWCGSSEDAQQVYSALEELSALEPAAPEGRQPVAWLCIRGDNIGLCFPSDEGAFPVYATRPSEQAVTEAHQIFTHMHRKFKFGDRVTKVKGSSWTGHVVGFYSTSLTPIGYAVESETETGSVQIYPEAALRRKE